MCTQVWIADIRLSIRSIGELASLVGVTNLVIHDGYHTKDAAAFMMRHEHCCLCPVDIDATAKNAGYQVEWEHGDTVWRHHTPAVASAEEGA